MTQSDYAKNIENERAARRERARQAASGEVAEIKAEQARIDALTPAEREAHDAEIVRRRVERVMGAREFRGLRDYRVVTPVATPDSPTGWSYRVEFTTNDLDWMVGEVKFFGGQRGGSQRVEITGLADPTAPWIPLYADEA